jgi:hypothetical protein
MALGVLSFIIPLRVLLDHQQIKAAGQSALALSRLVRW